MVLSVEFDSPVPRLALKEKLTVGALWIHPESHRGQGGVCQAEISCPSHLGLWNTVCVGGGVGEGWRNGAHPEALALGRRVGVGQG